MSPADSHARVRRSALFVDFDNIYVGLRRGVSEEAAEAFATDPLRWIRWFERGLPTREQQQSGELPVERSVLIRRVYLNPKPNSRFRPYFTRAAFKVVDCPSLTSHDKNSADIQMVMDILDTLQHETRFDEFIILSGDADFTPMLLRLRANDRRTLVLTTSPTAESYLAACDRVITEDIFIEDALAGVVKRPAQVAGEAPPPPPGAIADDVLRKIGRRVYEEAAATGVLAATALPRLFREFPEFTPESNWLGYFSLRRLTARIVALHPELKIIESEPSWQIAVVSPSAGDSAQQKTSLPHGDLRQRIIETVAQIVGAAKGAVPLPSVAETVRQQLGADVIDTRWCGAGSLRDLIKDIDHGGFKLSEPPGTAGFLYDPHLHGGPPPESADPLAAKYPELAALTRRVSFITSVPRLTPEEYADVFECIAAAMEQQPDERSAAFLADTARELSIERGFTIAKSEFNRILRAIAYAHQFFEPTSESRTPRGLATAFLRGVIMHCNDAQLELSPEDSRLLARWILGDHGQPDQEHAAQVN